MIVVVGDLILNKKDLKRGFATPEQVFNFIENQSQNGDWRCKKSFSSIWREDLKFYINKDFDGFGFSQGKRFVDLRFKRKSTDFLQKLKDFYNQKILICKTCEVFVFYEDEKALKKQEFCAVFLKFKLKNGEVFKFYNEVSLNKYLREVENVL